MHGVFRVRCRAVLAAALVLACGGGCFPSRGDVLNEVTGRRRQALGNWREGRSEEDMLPHVAGELSVADAIKLGLHFSPSLRGVVEEKERARGGLFVAYSEGLPTVTAGGGYTRVDGETADFTGTVDDTWSAGLSVTQPLFKGGKIPAAISGARYFELLSDETVRQAVQDTIASVATRYYDVLLAQHLVDVQLSALEFAQKNLGDVTAREVAGITRRFDRLRAQVEVSNVEADLIRQQNQLNLARTALLRAMGVSQRSEAQLTDELSYMPMEPDFEEAVSIAYVHRPELFRAELDARVEEETLKSLHADYFPTLEGFGDLTWLKPDVKEAGHNDSGDEWRLGVRLSWTIFDGLRREGEIIAQKATIQQSLMALADAEQQVLEDVRNGILAVQDADKLVRSQQLNLKRAQEALHLVEVSVQAGESTELQVLDARSALTRTVGLYYAALYAHTVARLELQRAIGTLGPDPGVGDVPAFGPEPGVIPLFMPDGTVDAPAGAVRAEPQQVGPEAEPDVGAEPVGEGDDAGTPAPEPVDV